MALAAMLVPAAWATAAAAPDPELVKNPDPAVDAGATLTLERDGNWLIIKGGALGEDGLRINYLEAYCRAGSTAADWVEHTRMRHRTETVAADEDGRRLHLRDTLEDGLVVDHVITAHADHVLFMTRAHNPTDRRSEAHWAQPCVRVGPFTGTPSDADLEDERYLHRCFIFIDGELQRLPTQPWATEARYTPGQVWRPQDVPEDDVNPRPLSPLHPSHGLIGCFSADGEHLLALAWEPWQELFQGVAHCIHADFRLGGIEPGETREIIGRAYVLPADGEALLARYEEDFGKRED